MKKKVLNVFSHLTDVVKYNFGLFETLYVAIYVFLFNKIIFTFIQMQKTIYEAQHIMSCLWKSTIETIVFQKFKSHHKALYKEKNTTDCMNMMVSIKSVYTHIHIYQYNILILFIN